MADRPVRASKKDHDGDIKKGEIMPDSLPNLSDREKIKKELEEINKGLEELKQNKSKKILYKWFVFIFGTLFILISIFGYLIYPESIFFKWLLSFFN